MFICPVLDHQHNFLGKFGSKVKLSKFYHGVKRSQNETAVKKVVSKWLFKKLKRLFLF